MHSKSLLSSPRLPISPFVGQMGVEPTRASLPTTTSKWRVYHSATGLIINKLRRMRDSNPRALLQTYRVSNAAPSPTWVILQITIESRLQRICFYRLFELLLGVAPDRPSRFLNPRFSDPSHLLRTLFRWICGLVS